MILPLLWGATLVAGFAPLGLWPLVPLGMALFLASLDHSTPKQAALQGLSFGLGLHGAGISWVYISLHHYGNAPLSFAVVANLLLILLMATYPALMAYLLLRLSPQPGWRRWLLMAPGLWVLSEWLRSWLFTGFPWLSLGYSQTDAPLAGIAPMGGVFAIGLLLMLSAGALLSLWRTRHWSALVLLGVIWGGGEALRAYSWASPLGEPLQVVLVQGNISQERKFAPGVLDETLSTYLNLSLPEAPSADLIIWPETAIPVFYDTLGEEFFTNLTQHAQDTHTDYLTGIPSGDWQNGEYYNSVVSIGDTPGFYHKHRLLPFGEYLPLRGVFNFFHRFVDIPMADFSRGAAQQTLLQAAGHPVGVSICFEAVFGSEIRRTLPQAAYLVNVSNDAWFGRSLAPEQHLQIARMRSLEMARPMARATNTGISALMDHQGHVLARSDWFVTTTVRGEIQPMQGATPYATFGDWPALLLAALLVVAGRWRYRIPGNVDA